MQLLGAIDNRGRTALHAAASGGHRQLLSLLESRGGDMGKRDADGATPREVLRLAAAAAATVQTPEAARGQGSGLSVSASASASAGTG